MHGVPQGFMSRAFSPYKPTTIKSKYSTIESSKNQKLLDVFLDDHFPFDDHVIDIYQLKDSCIIYGSEPCDIW